MWMLRTAKPAVVSAIGSAFDGASNTSAWVLDRDHHALLGTVTIGLSHSRLLIIVYASEDSIRVAALLQIFFETYGGGDNRNK
jgi:hypothetical protein